MEIRPLQPSDKQAMKRVCDECFPIDYPDERFDKQLTGDADLISVGAWERNGGRELAGIIVGHNQTLSDVESDNGTLLNQASRDDTAMYIVIFGEQPWPR